MGRQYNLGGITMAKRRSSLTLEQLEGMIPYYEEGLVKAQKEYQESIENGYKSFSSCEDNLENAKHELRSCKREIQNILKEREPMKEYIIKCTIDGSDNVIYVNNRDIMGAIKSVMKLHPTAVVTSAQEE
jgi:hypothetical protein